MRTKANSIMFFQVLHPSARDCWVLLPDVAADQGPQVQGVGLGDGSGAGQALQVRGRILGHQKCLPGLNLLSTFLHFFVLACHWNLYFCLVGRLNFWNICNTHKGFIWAFQYYPISLWMCMNFYNFLVKVASGGMDDPAVSHLLFF